MAKKHMVKCLYCNEYFDANAEEFEKVKRRYAHKHCFDEHEKNKTDEERDFEALEKYILERITHETCLSLRVRRQIEEYKNDCQYSYSGILKTLIYFYDIKGNSTARANGGIGIVPYVYQEAYEYYLNVHRAQQLNQEKKVETYQMKKNTVTIHSPRLEVPPPRLFNLED